MSFSDMFFQIYSFVFKIKILLFDKNFHFPILIKKELFF